MTLVYFVCIAYIAVLAYALYTLNRARERKIKKKILKDGEQSELNKTILAERIYPAIRSCVGNRYKIIIGLFAFYAFMWKVEETILAPFQKREVAWIVNILFIFLILHNAVNYFLNKREQDWREHNGSRQTSLRDWISNHGCECLIEILFSGGAITVLLFGPTWFLP